ncbi:hypothetical protein L596_022779 [Steinernema carpocapsae]|uniref:Uncharacterized protein n=1 Tax=Steinernema carpocapsae TaxID=34508 RepID=A0A4U5MMT8_STECR|nr:hypothetical protein L596_022779 [Steinernema carpocapsae]
MEFVPLIYIDQINDLLPRAEVTSCWTKLRGYWYKSAKRRVLSKTYRIHIVKTGNELEYKCKSTKPIQAWDAQLDELLEVVYKDCNVTCYSDSYGFESMSKREFAFVLSMLKENRFKIDTLCLKQECNRQTSEQWPEIANAVKEVKKAILPVSVQQSILEKVKNTLQTH